MDKIIQLYDKYLALLEKKSNNTYYTWEDYAADLYKVASDLHQAYQSARRPAIRGIGKLVYNEVEEARRKANQRALTGISIS